MSFEPGVDLEDANTSGRMVEAVNKKLSFASFPPPTPRAGLHKQKCGEPLQVFLRVRPLAADDTDSEECVVASGDSVELNAPLDSAAAKNGEMKSRLTFSTVFGPESTQQQVYQIAASPLVEALTEGQNGLLFAYGVTNSGKTFTIQGNKGNEGIIPRVVTNLFSLLERSPTTRYVTVSYVEIYNDKIFDLLDGTPKGHTRKACSLRNTAQDRVIIVGAKEIMVESAKEAMLALQQGIDNRCVGQTLLNADSSRSHSVFTITLLSEDRSTPWARLSVCDLAGAERLKRAEHNTGRGIKEATNINSSLSVLARCLDILRKNQSIADPLKRMVVPFRESVLTRLFRDSLMGWGRTVMITNANPQAQDFDETIHILKYAAIAREIHIQPKVDTRRPQPSRVSSACQEIDDEAPLVLGLESDNEEEIDAFLDQIYQLKMALVEGESRLAKLEVEIRSEVCNEAELQLAQTEAEWKERVEQEKIKASKRYEAKLRLCEFEMKSRLSADEQSRINNALLVERKVYEAATERTTAENEMKVRALQRKITELEQEAKRAIVLSPVPPPKPEVDEALLEKLALLDTKILEAENRFTLKQQSEIARRENAEIRLLEETAKHQAEILALEDEQKNLRAEMKKEKIIAEEEQKQLKGEKLILVEQNKKLNEELKSEKTNQQNEVKLLKDRCEELQRELTEAKSAMKNLSSQLTKEQEKNVHVKEQETSFLHAKEQEMNTLKREKLKEYEKLINTIKDMETEKRNWGDEKQILEKAQSVWSTKYEAQATELQSTLDTNKVLMEALEEHCQGKPPKCSSCRLRELEQKRSKKLHEPETPPVVRRGKSQVKENNNDNEAKSVISEEKEKKTMQEEVKIMFSQEQSTEKSLSRHKFAFDTPPTTKKTKPSNFVDATLTASIASTFPSSFPSTVKKNYPTPTTTTIATTTATTATTHDFSATVSSFSLASVPEVTTLNFTDKSADNNEDANNNHINHDNASIAEQREKIIALAQAKVIEVVNGDNTNDYEKVTLIKKAKSKGEEEHSKKNKASPAKESSEEPALDLEEPKATRGRKPARRGRPPTKKNTLSSLAAASDSEDEPLTKKIQAKRKSPEAKAREGKSATVEPLPMEEIDRKALELELPAKKSRADRENKMPSNLPKPPSTSTPKVESKIVSKVDVKTPSIAAQSQKPDIKPGAPTPIARRTRQRIKI